LVTFARVISAAAEYFDCAASAPQYGQSIDGLTFWAEMGARNAVEAARAKTTSR
jgi:hypothetical protein